MTNEILPVGAITIWGGDQRALPNNWMVCDGKTVSRRSYPGLYGAIGDRWDNGKKKEEGEFNLPDLRGVFLRGVNDGRNDGYQDLGTTERARLDGDTNHNDDAGSYQKGSVERHHHELAIVQNNGVPGGHRGPDGNSNTGYHTVSLPTGLYGSDETRPVNAYVYYIIKVG